MGASSAVAMRAPGLAPSSSLRPPSMAPHMAMLATNEIPVATPAATEPMRMSRVADAAELMREDATDLVPRTGGDQSLGDGDGGVVGVAPRREGVGLGLGGDVKPRHRHASAAGELAHDREVLRVAGLVGGHGPGRPDGERVALPVGEPDDGQAQDEADDGPAPPKTEPMATMRPPKPASRTAVLAVLRNISAPHALMAGPAVTIVGADH